MAPRMCTCKHCGNKILSETAYRVVSSANKGTYCSIEHYEQLIKEKTFKSMSINLLYELLEIQFKDSGAFLNRNFKEIYPTYSYEQIYKTIDELSLEIQMRISNLKTSQHKILYTFTMIKSKLFALDDVVEQKKYQDMETIKVEDIKVEDDFVVKRKPRQRVEAVKQNGEVDFDIDF